MKEKAMSDMTDNAMKNYEQAVRAGLKIQEEAGRWWSNMLANPAINNDWQKRFTGMSALAQGFVPLAQKRMEDVVDLMEKNSRTTADLMKKAVEAAQAPAIADSQAKWLEFWTSSMGAVRTNTEAMTQIGSKAIDSWIDYVRKNSESFEPRPSRSA